MFNSAIYIYVYSIDMEVVARMKRSLNRAKLEATSLERNGRIISNCKNDDNEDATQAIMRIMRNMNSSDQNPVYKVDVLVTCNKVMIDVIVAYITIDTHGEICIECNPRIKIDQVNYGENYKEDVSQLRMYRPSKLRITSCENLRHVCMDYIDGKFPPSGLVYYNPTVFPFAILNH